MHEAAFAHLGLDWYYLPFDVHPDRLGDAVRGLGALGFAGVNVTVPHKEAVLGLADLVEESARVVGAANTLLFRDGAVQATNTDVAGFTEAVNLGFGPATLAGARIVVVGAGGAARAVVGACIAAGAHRVEVLNRTIERATNLVASFGAQRDASPHAQREASRTQLYARSTNVFAEAVVDADLVVQTTSCGMDPARTQTPVRWPRRVSPDTCVFDCIYAPAMTLFLQEARAAGARTHGGLGMLVAQGALAFERWTRHTAPRTVMLEAAAKALHARA